MSSARLLSKVKLNATEDDVDVAAEKKRVLSGQCNDILKIQNLTKVYKKRGAGKKKNMVAVDR